MPMIQRHQAPHYHRQAYPGRHRERTTGCWKWRLSDAGGLTQFGAGEVELAPGAATGLYHWHVHEDEFVYVLEGDVVLVEGDAEYPMKPGDCACFPAGAAVGHTFENRSQSRVRLLEIGTRHPDGETAYYPGLDMVYRRDAGGVHFETRDGRPLLPDDQLATIDDEHNRKPSSPLDIP